MIAGCLTALITPFRNGQLDETALSKLIRHQLDGGIHGLVVVGTTGESPTLSEREHKRVVDLVVQETAGQVPVVAGAGSNNPAEAIAYARHAQSVGADAVLAVAGYYNRPSQEGLYQHFRALHDSTDIPIVIYNIPPRCIVDVLPDTMARLAELPRVIGVKDATGELGRINHERSRIQKPFSYLSGDDITALAYNASGGHGCISVASNVLPAECSRIQELCADNDFAAALAIHEQLVPFYTALFREPNPAGIKYAASLMELCEEECRLPMVPLSDVTREAIRQALQSR
ncbi:4-hydroxy-tetrahydrodipicolinate synthase [Nitrincola sp. MINF-07-Sa-05]|uniref:4-hydroxy-tetrahydrodipicolinate synthase n=1 Tax=Nitrincola salilacus TaxID=3400273 RepID=UPI0039181F8B